jgi:hypothetical protein
MTASSVSPALVEDDKTLPDFVDVDKTTVYLQGNTFALIVPQNLGVGHYEILVPANGHDRVDLNNDESFECRSVPVEGQRSRLEGLFAAINDRDWSETARRVESLTRFEAALMETDIWSYTERHEEVGDVLRQRGRGHELNRVETLDFMRRFSFAGTDELDCQLVKLADGDEDTIRREIQAALDEHGEVGAEDVSSMAVRQDEGLSSAITTLLRHYEQQGYMLAGGSPDSGIMLFVDPSSLEGVNGAESAQRAAKIFMRGGRPMDSGESFNARLVDFESGRYGSRDGIFMVLSNAIGARMARESGIEAGWSYQGQFIDIGRALMKGMVYVAGEDAPASDLRNILHHAQMSNDSVEAAIDLSIWNKVVGTDHEEGDVVSIDPSDLWVMESDVRNDISSVRISSQLVERAGEMLTTWLASNMGEAFGEFAEAIKSGEGMEDYVSPFGRLGKMAERGLDFFRSDTDDVREEMDDSVANFARNGARIRGTSIRLFYDDNLSADTSDGSQVPGARVPESWGLEPGDHFLFCGYPALPALDGEGRNTCIFTVQVEETSPAPHLYMNGTTIDAALRDEDGDKPVCIVPEDGTVPVVGQARMDLSTKVKTTDNKKAQVFEAEATSKSDFAVYSRLGSQVGRADKLVTSTLLYLGDEIEDVETPVADDAPTVFMSKCIQASIEAKKHVTDERYALRELREWTKEVVPEAWQENEDGTTKFVHHPAMNVREPSGGETTIAEHVEALGELEGSDLNNGTWAEMLKGLFHALPMRTDEDGERHVVLNDDAFVGESFYADAGWELFQAADSLFEDGRVADRVSKMAETIWHDAKDAGEAARGNLDEESAQGKLAYHKAQVRHLKVAGLRLRMELTPVEFTVVSAYFAMKYAQGTTGSGRLKAALAVCPPEHLEVLAAIGEGEISGDEEIIDALGFDGRNTVTSSLEDKTKHLGRAYNATGDSAGKQVLVKPREDGQRLEAGDLVTAGKPGTTVRKLTRSDGTEFWLQDGSQGELPPAREFRVRDTAGYAVTLVRERR